MNGSLRIGTTGSHVPHESLDQARAAFVPDITQAVSRAPLGLVPGQPPCPVSMSTRYFSTRHQRFTCVRLPDPYLTRCPRAFSSPLTTLALYQRSVRWFGTWSCTPVPRGPPSSLVQHCFPFRLAAFGCAFVAQGARRTCWSHVGQQPRLRTPRAGRQRRLAQGALTAGADVYPADVLADDEGVRVVEGKSLAIRSSKSPA